MKGKPSLLQLRFAFRLIKSGALLHNLAWSNFLLFRIPHEIWRYFSTTRHSGIRSRTCVLASAVRDVTV